MSRATVRAKRDTTAVKREASDDRNRLHVAEAWRLSEDQDLPPAGPAVLRHTNAGKHGLVADDPVALMQREALV